MELKNAAMVIVDISGYTKFIQDQKLSLLHAESIISQLLETVIDAAKYPLVLNKLEGDAAFLYAFVEDDAKSVLLDITQQTISFFSAFQQKAVELALDTSSCSCDACTNIGGLKLKAFLHYGTVVLKNIRHFEELAGDNVILIHRLLKNSLAADEYLLMTQPFFQVTGSGVPGFRQSTHTEEYKDLGVVTTEVYYPGFNLPIPPAKRSSFRRLKITISRIRLFIIHVLGFRLKQYQHIPNRRIRFADLIDEIF